MTTKRVVTVDYLDELEKAIQRAPVVEGVRQYTLQVTEKLRANAIEIDVPEPEVVLAGCACGAGMPGTEWSVRYRESSMFPDRWQHACMRCGAQTPFFDTKKQAGTVWNAMQDAARGEG